MWRTYGAQFCQQIEMSVKHDDGEIGLLCSLENFTPGCNRIWKTSVMFLVQFKKLLFEVRKVRSEKEYSVLNVFGGLHVYYLLFCICIESCMRSGRHQPN